MVKKITIVIFFLLCFTRIIYLYNKRYIYSNIYKDKTNIIVNGLSAPRGRILDINGKELVVNRMVKTIFYHKTNDNEIHIARRIASVIDIDYPNDEDIFKKYYYLTHKDIVDELISNQEYELYKKRKITNDELYKLKLQRINKNMLDDLSDLDKKSAYIYDLLQRGYSYEDKTIKEDVSEEEYARILSSNIPGIFGGITLKREYPYNDVFKSILGTVGPISKELKEDYLNKGYAINDIVGTSYLEYQYEKYLRGSKAKYRVENNNILKKIKEEKPGNDIVLNIDIDIQEELENILKREITNAKKEKNTGYFKESYVIVSNPKTGAIIAMSGKRYLKEDTFIDVTPNIINTSYIVGSVVKGATISVGYNNNIINENTSVIDSCVKLYLVPEKCSYKRLGRVNDITALKESSNYYQFLIAIGLTGNKYYHNMKLNASKEHFEIYRNTLADYGLGVLTGIDLPNEKLGITGNIVSDDLLLNLAIGQYDTYTPIMLSTYINAIASNGLVKKPTLLNKVVYNNNDIYISSQAPIRKVKIEDKYLERIKKGFNLVTTSGTARGYISSKTTSAGKTGTSESFYDSNMNGVMDSKTINTTFVGFFPFDNPKYSITIISPNISNYKDNDYYISRINKKIASQISEYLINK